MEYFAAIAYKIFQFPFRIHMQVFLVLLVIRIPFEDGVAHVAFDRIVAGVYIDMLAEFLLGYERFVTYVATVRFDFHVTFLMQHVAGSGVEFFTTSHALVRMHFQDMFVVFLDVRKMYQTSGTHTIAFLDAVHVFQMLQKRRTGFEILAANATHYVFGASGQIGRVVFALNDFDFWFSFAFEFYFFPEQ